MVTPQKAAAWTYRQLVQPIPPERNLLNIGAAPPSPPCAACTRLLLPDRTNIPSTTIPIDDYQVLDTFPDFPVLQTSAVVAGCDFCRLLRDAIRRAWGDGARPMLESGATPLAEDDDAYEPLLAAAWDGAVKIRRVDLRFRPFGGSFQHQQRFAWDEVAGALEQGDGVVVGMSLEFGPATDPLGDDGEVLAAEIGRVLHFKVYDSIGKSGVPVSWGLKSGIQLTRCADLESAISASRRNLPSGDTLSERNIDLIKGWIDGCMTNHGNACQAINQWMPTRLLAVNPLRLVETADGSVQDDDRRYAALSYTRGTASSDAAMRTTLENCEERKEGMDLAELPRAFRDAVFACRALGIPFLWIDALCIMDAAEDRNREVALMPKTFGNAQVTFTAYVHSEPSPLPPQPFAVPDAMKLEHPLHPRSLASWAEISRLSLPQRLGMRSDP